MRVAKNLMIQFALKQLAPTQRIYKQRRLHVDDEGENCLICELKDQQAWG